MLLSSVKVYPNEYAMAYILMRVLTKRNDWGNIYSVNVYPNEYAMAYILGRVLTKRND